MMRVSILMLCYNKVEYTRRCVDALRANTSPSEYELIAVDNASKDGTPGYLAALAREMPNVKVVRSEENLGFVGGNNLGAQSAQGEFLFFLNNDAEVQPGWLPPLLHLMDEDPKTGAAGSKLVYPDGRLQEAGGIIFRDGSGWNFGKGGDPDAPEYNYVREVDYCSGAALLVRAGLFNRLGGFDTLFQPAYCEDTDLCFALRREGFRVMYHPHSVVTHHEGVTAGTDLGKGFKKFQAVNVPKFLKKWEAEMAHQPAPTGDMRYGRFVSDRRCRRAKQVLVAADEPPQFDRQGGGLGFYNFILRLMEAGHHVTFVARNSTWRGPDVDLEPYVRALQLRGAMVYGLDKMTVQDGRSPMVQILHDRRYDSALLWTAREGFFFIEHLQELQPATRIAVVMGDLAVLREGRATLASADPLEWRRLRENRDVEFGVYRRVDAVLTNTEADKLLVGDFLPPEKVHFVPDYYPVVPQPPDFATRQGLVFLAGFRHLPNVDAAVYLLDEIMPLVREQLPEVELVLLGADPPEHLRARADSHTRITGFVPEVQPHLLQARVAVVPLRYGSGIKGKICQAMATGTPNVTTPIGAEGMDLEVGRDLLVGGDARALAEAIVRLYLEEPLWRKISEGGYRLVAERYSALAQSRALLPAVVPEKKPACLAQAVELENLRLLAEGYRHLQDQTPDLAEETFREALRSKDTPAGHAGLGQVALVRGRRADARSEFETALRLDAKADSARVLLADLLHKDGKIREAQRLLEERIENGPDSPLALGKLAQLYLRKGKTDLAMNCLERAVEADPSAPAAWSKLAELRQAKGDLDGAAATLEKAIAILPAADLWARLGDLEMQRLQWVKAEEAWTQAIRLVPGHPNPWAMRGAARSFRGLRSQALADYSRAAMLALDARQPELACMIDTWMSAVAAGQPVPSRPKPDKAACDKYFQIAKDCEETGKECGRPGPVSSYELIAASGLLHDRLAGTLPETEFESRAAGLEEPLFALTRRRIARARTDGEEALASRLQALLRSLALRLIRAAGVEVDSPPPGVPAESTAEVDIIIPIYNNVSLVRACINSVLRTQPRASLILVDDFSPDPEVRQLLREFAERPRVRTLRLEKNLGFVGACRAGADAASAEFLLFLNSDIECIAPGWLQAMLPVDPQTAVVGARLLFPPGTDSPWAGAIQHAGVARNALGLPYHPLQGQRADHPLAETAHPLNAVTGACMLVRRPVWVQLNGFDPVFGRGIYEDVDFCYRVRREGYRIWYQPAATLYHHEHGSARAGKTLDEENERANRKLLLDRWGQLPSDESLFLAASFLSEGSGFNRAEETLRLLLESDDLPKALIAMEERLDEGLLMVVRRDMETARRENQLELAEGLKNLAEYVVDVLKTES